MCMPLARSARGELNARGVCVFASDRSADFDRNFYPNEAFNTHPLRKERSSTLYSTSHQMS